MDQYSEVEAKFAAEKVTLEQLKAFAENIHDHPVLGPRGYEVHTYKKADGMDVFYKMGEGTVRYRFDELRKINKFIGDRQIPVGAMTLDDTKFTMFTVKDRRSDANLLNRKEVDVKLHHSVTPDDIEAFMKLMKAEKDYKILKDYEIWYMDSEKLGVKVCFAMYDVKRPNGADKRRFVEVEIERDSTCSAKEGRDELQVWIPVLREQFGFEAPANVSLYELYGTK